MLKKLFTVFLTIFLVFLIASNLIASAASLLPWDDTISGNQGTTEQPPSGDGEEIPPPSEDEDVPPASEEEGVPPSSKEEAELPEQGGDETNPDNNTQEAVSDDTEAGHMSDEAWIIIISLSALTAIMIIFVCIYKKNKKR